MLASYALCEPRLFSHEGGYTNDPRDPGGPTNWGVTIYDARKYAAKFNWITDRQVTAADVKAMPKSFAAQVFKAEYWDALRCDLLPAGVDYSIFDYGVNSGIGRSGKVLRRLLGLSDKDWHVTDEVISAVKQRDPAKLISAINEERMRFLRGLSTFDHFGNGWTRRVNEVTSFSLQLAAGKAPAPVPADKPKPGKGKVQPPSTKGVQNGGAAGTAVASGLVQFFGDHPVLTAAVAVACIVAIILVVKRIKDRATAAQEAPTAGTAVVPAKV